MCLAVKSFFEERETCRTSEDCRCAERKIKIISAISSHKEKPYQQGCMRRRRAAIDPVAQRQRAQQQRGFKAPLLNLAGELRVGEMKLWTGEWLQTPEIPFTPQQGHLITLSKVAAAKLLFEDGNTG